MFVNWGQEWQPVKKNFQQYSNFLLQSTLPTWDIVENRLIMQCLQLKLHFTAT